MNFKKKINFAFSNEYPTPIKLNFLIKILILSIFLIISSSIQLYFYYNKIIKKPPQITLQIYFAFLHSAEFFYGFLLIIWIKTVWNTLKKYQIHTIIDYESIFGRYLHIISLFFILNVILEIFQTYYYYFWEQNPGNFTFNKKSMFFFIGMEINDVILTTLLSFICFYTFVLNKRAITFQMSIYFYCLVLLIFSFFSFYYCQKFNNLGKNDLNMKNFINLNAINIVYYFMIILIIYSFLIFANNYRKYKIGYQFFGIFSIFLLVFAFGLSGNIFL